MRANTGMRLKNPTPGFLLRPRTRRLGQNPVAAVGKPVPAQLLRPDHLSAMAAALGGPAAERERAV